MNRRTFLKSTGIAMGVITTGGLLAACGDGDGGAAVDVPDVVREADSSEGTWNLITATYELLTGDSQRLAFALTKTDNTPVQSESVQLYTRTPEGEVLGGPFEVEYHGVAEVGLPLYRSLIDVPQAGTIEIVAVAGEDYGFAALNAVEPEASTIPVPGGPAIVVATPTADDDLGVVELCTREQDCSMHEVSLKEALEGGRPVVLLFATPAYCQTAVCGPSVDTLEEIAQSRDWGDIAFIHAEIFSDAGETVTNHVRAWNLPSEPWLFTIDSEGRIVRRLDGPMIGDELRDAAEELLA